MKKIALTAVVSVLVAVSPAMADVLFYEDFEGDLSQWDIVGNSIITSAYGFNSTHSQTFTAVAAGGDARTIKLSDTPGETYYLHVAYMTLGGGGFIGIDLFNSSQAYLGEQWLIGDGGYGADLWSYNVGAQNPSDLGVWEQYTRAYTPAANVAYIRIKTEDFSGGLPNNADVFFDNIEWSTSPTPIPVPGAMLLGAMGLGMVGWLKRRKKEA